jgi:hypothetical protein
MANAGDIQLWLAQHGFGKYAEAFASNDIDVDVLLELTDADLKDLGVASLGDRKRLLKAIASLAAANMPTAVATEVPRPPRDSDHGQRIPSAERRQVTIMFCDLSARPLSPLASIPKTCGRSSAATIAAAPNRLPRPADL